MGTLHAPVTVECVAGGEVGSLVGRLPSTCGVQVQLQDTQLVRAGNWGTAWCGKTPTSGVSVLKSVVVAAIRGESFFFSQVQVLIHWTSTESTPLRRQQQRVLGG